MSFPGGSAGFALKILRTEVLRLYDELLDILAAPNSDIARLHKLADQISRKADSESFEVIVTLLNEHLRQSVRAEAVNGQGRDRLDRQLRLWDKTRGIFAQAEAANLDRKLAFINAVSDITGVMA